MTEHAGSFSERSDVAIYLTSEYDLWCVETGEQTVTCCLPVGRAGAIELIDVPELGRVGVVSECREPPVAGAVPLGLRALFDQACPSVYGAAARAVPLAEWRRTARFCGVCGAAMERDETERMMRCPSCVHRTYPRIQPVVIVRITRGDELLLARRKTAPNGFFSVIAGFVEAGESLEEALAREVLEEVGITVGNIRYFDSQPWSFPSNLMIAFTAEHAGGEVRADGVEMAEAGWFRRQALPTLPGPISIARRMIDAWLAERPRRPRE